jgi:aspartate/methionine/tyrosine aminotransferase
MTIGEPRHGFPPWVSDIIAEHAADFGRYPQNEGTPGLLGAVADWVARRYGVTLEAEAQVLALNGTREGLYSAMAALCPETKHGGRPVVLMPNPFYQAYAAAALSVGAEPDYLPATAETGHLPDLEALPETLLNRVAAIYMCSPSNPQGAVAGREYWAHLIRLAEHYDFQVLADECYSEIYRDTPPPGALEVARELGADPERVLSFNSLSKRSNVPGLRAGFVAGGPESIRRMRQLRYYGGAPLPMPLQHAAQALWADEAHVADNRALYREKYMLADGILEGVPGYRAPEAGFFLWLPVADGEDAALRLWRETGVRVLPGAYLSRETGAGNPGRGYIRAALVGPKDETAQGLAKLRDCLFA